MTYGFLDIAVTPSVRDAQVSQGVPDFRQSPADRGFDRFREDEIAFISTRDSFYMSSVSETGWPYIQHRGGPPGFLRVLDDRTLAFADFRGNRQYISLGNLSANDRACLFLMDYPRRARLKIYVRVEVRALGDDPEFHAALLMPGYRGKAERAFVLHLEAFDWNCQQHITPRFTEAEIAASLERIRVRLETLEAENAALRAKLSAMSPGQAGV